MKTFTYIAPSGVRVTSNIPPVDPKWWDGEKVHRLWSWASWITLVLHARGLKFPRKMFVKYLSR